MSIRVMATVWEHSTSRGGDLLVLLAIADFAHDNGVAFPSVPTLAAKARLTSRQVSTILKRLHSRGELEIRPNAGPQGTNLYRVLTPMKELQRGDEARNTGGMKPTSYEPSGNRHKTLAAGGAAAGEARYTKAQRDAVWDALVEATGIDPATIGERSRFGKSVKQLLDAGASPDEIRARAQRYRMKYQGAALTDTALANRWGELSGRRVRSAQLESCPECGETVEPRKLAAHRYDRHDVGTLCPECAEVILPEEVHACKRSGA